MAGALTGSDAALGININNGVQLAIDKHNAANPGCQVQLKPFDTEGDPQKAIAIAPQIVDDAFTIGLVGPAFSGETKATGGVFAQAGLVAATASATNPTLSENGWPTFFRGLANDGVQGPAVANYMKNTLGYKKICVVDDSTDYGLGLAQAIRDTLGPVADVGCNISVKKGDKDFSAAAIQVKDVSPDAVFFSGYYAEAAPFAQQLKDGGVTATFVSGDGTNEPEFVKQAGEASKDAILSCPCGPATGAFAEEYTKQFGQEPGTYSVEGYDLGTIMLKGIDSGAITRPALLDYVKNYDGNGLPVTTGGAPTVTGLRVHLDVRGQVITCLLQRDQRAVPTGRRNRQAVTHERGQGGAGYRRGSSTANLVTLLCVYGAARRPTRWTLVNPLCRAGEVGLFSHRDEVLELPKFHNG